jgi:hypothetical protein
MDEAAQPLLKAAGLQCGSAAGEAGRLQPHLFTRS